MSSQFFSFVYMFENGIFAHLIRIAIIEEIALPGMVAHIRLINKRRESSNVNYGCRTLVVGQGRLEEEREPIPDISKDASLGGGSAGGPGLGPAAGESKLLELVGRSSASATRLHMKYWS